MPTHLEIEYKSLLSLSEFEKLETLFSHVKPIQQVNYYFDSEDLILREKRLALRIRCFSESAELTLKVPQEVGNIEHNIELPLKEAKRFISQKSLLNGKEDISEIINLIKSANVDLNSITCIGSLKTIRREYQMPIGLAALDQNEYLGTSDFEFELEVKDNQKGQEDFLSFLEKNNIEFRYARSKVVRFLDTLRYKK
ncbi:MAG: CYTH domain-containing protein [Lactovum sp.]